MQMFSNRNNFVGSQNGAPFCNSTFNNTQTEYKMKEVKIIHLVPKYQRIGKTTNGKFKGNGYYSRQQSNQERIMIFIS